MKTISPLELLKHISIFTPDVNEEVRRKLFYAVGSELEKDPEHNRLRQKAEQSYSEGFGVGHIENMYAELNQYVFDNLFDNVIETEVTIQFTEVKTSVLNRLSMFLTAKEEEIKVLYLWKETIKVIGTIRDFVTVEEIISLNFTHELSKRKLIIQTASNS
ncbi:hypothetical protein P0C28_11265 [Aeromonas hydrophila]|uniref:hypothetical protein n=1 Tax=Aeromonas hydrophila TaxID=644 RepID=UPI0023AFD208|nr:hypothetical protein [Aeromonas hydrophila]MDE8809833.1 hypothetical protein [Aeromonas hydrophila]